MRLSLRYRLLAPLLVLLAGDFAATGWAAWTAVRHAEQRIADQLRAVARTLTEPPTFPLSPRVLEQMKSLSGAEFLLVRRDGSRTTTFADPLTPPPDDVPTGPAPGLGPPVTVAGAEYRCLRLPLRQQPNAGDILYVFYPESLRRSAVWDAARPLLLLGGIGGLIGVGLVVLVSRRLVARVRELDRSTRLIAAGDFRPLPLPSADDEVRDLYRSVNDMAGRLAEFQEALQKGERLKVLGQFSGGLAHQLRNAATGAKLAVELHAADCAADDRESLTVALRQLDRIETNLRQFLDLGKPPTLAKEPCDLAALLTQTVELLMPQCRHAGTAMRWESPTEPAMIPGDATQLGHLFLNVIGNAVEAAGPGGTVEVVLSPSPLGGEGWGGGWVVEVADTGPGPPAALAGHLFDPFVTGKDQGIGLGLSVARQAAEAHGGSLSWERRDKRTIFRIALPGY
ncbi:MAG TPA: HAMP domain-containing sensor histidine kinase [Fimbriiglobus sp.]|nr:HAMP domain-containing sensor histidine kinase [Fimbriiglobus sp.]